MSKAGLLTALVVGALALPVAGRASPDCDLIHDLSEVGPMDGGGLAVDAWGGFVIADPVGDRLLKSRTTGGALLEIWGSRGSGPGEFRDPADVAIGPDGAVYVADTGNCRIQKFDHLGCYLTGWGTVGKDPGQFRKLVAVTVDTEGFVHALDARNHTVQKFTPDGELVRIWKIPSPQEGGTTGGHREHFEQFSTEVIPGTRPSDLAVDRHGNLHVLFPDQGKVATYDPAGRLQALWGSLGSGPGQFVAPAAIGICPGSDMVYVSDPGGARVQLFTGSGYFVETWGAIDLAPQAVVRSHRLPGDRFRVPLSEYPQLDLPAALIAPRGIGVNGVGQVYVVDEANAAVIAFSFGKCPTRAETWGRPASCDFTIDPARYEEYRVVIPGTRDFEAGKVDLQDLWLGEGQAPLMGWVEDTAYRGLNAGRCESHPTDGLADLVLTFVGSDLLAAAGVEALGHTGEFTVYGHDLDGVPYWGTATIAAGRTSSDGDGDRDREHFEQFSYELPVAATVRTEVFDVSGRLVDRLPVEEQAAGVHRLRWDADGRAAGIYFVRVRAGENAFVRKILVR